MVDALLISGLDEHSVTPVSFCVLAYINFVLFWFLFRNVQLRLVLFFHLFHGHNSVLIFRFLDYHVTV